MFKERLLFLFFILFVCTGCGRIWGGITWDNQTIQVSVQLTVSKTYPINGSNWTYYVKNDGPDIFSALDNACLGTETGYAACLHGGQMLQVPLPGVSSCSGLSMTDSLGVFVWSCLVKNGVATFYSTDFQIGAGLQNLVNASGWINNSVTLGGTNGNYSYSGTTSPTAWWSNVSNPVVLLTDNHLITDNPVNLNVSGTIYILGASRGSEGYNFTADHISIVTLPGVTMNYAGRNNAWCDFGSPSLVCAGPRNFIWVEGNYDGNSSGGTDAVNNILFWGITNFSRLHLASSKNATGFGIEVHVSNSIADQIKSSNNGSSDFRMDSSTNSFVKSLIANGGGIDVTLAFGPTSTGNIFYQIDSANTSVQGFGGDGLGSGNALIQAVMFNSKNALGGLNFGNGGTNNVFSQLTSVNNLNLGFYVDSSGTNATFNTFNNLVGVNNVTGLGLSTAATTNNTFSQIVMTNNTTQGINIGNGANQNFAGNFMVGSNAVKNCNVTGGVNPGLINNTCSDTGVDGSSTYTGQLSNATLRTARNLSSSFLAKVTTTDSSNSSNVNGTATYPGAPKTFDFINFLNIFRGWGIDGPAFPSAGNQGGWTVGTGRIWDWRVSSGDTAILNKSGDGLTNNGSFVAGANCPAASYGSKTAADQWGHTYLLNAFEIIDPFTSYYSNTGNHNGLCETGDTCIYTPNFGAYQGEGTLQPCTFVQNGGPVSGVIMYGYSKNGD